MKNDCTPQLNFILCIYCLSLDQHDEELARLLLAVQLPINKESDIIVLLPDWKSPQHSFHLGFGKSRSTRGLQN